MGGTCWIGDLERAETGEEVGDDSGRCPTGFAGRSRNKNSWKSGIRDSIGEVERRKPRVVFVDPKWTRSREERDTPWIQQVWIQARAGRRGQRRNVGNQISLYVTRTGRASGTGDRDRDPHTTKQR